MDTEAAYRERCRAGLRLSPIGQVMIERCLVGWQEIEYEVMRDADDTCIAVCSMENVDPLGVHTGDSIVVAPVQTLPDPVHQRLRSAALAIIRALGVEGGCNVQFALSPDSNDYAVIEVNPRVSRSSALASKATGYPIARVAAQIAIGRKLAEIPNAITKTTVAAFEPALDYVVVKLPRFPFDKFPGADRSLGSQMKATGEVMAIDRTFGAALNKALRGLEQAGAGFLAEDPTWDDDLAALSGASAGGRIVARSQLLKEFLAPSDSRMWRLLALLRRGVQAAELHVVTGIAPWFLAEMERLVDLAHQMTEEGSGVTDATLVSAKRASFGDRDIATLTGLAQRAVFDRRRGHRPAAGLRDGRYLRRRVRRRDALFLCHLCRDRVTARGAAGRAARGAGHRVGSRAHRPGHRVRLLRRAGRRRPAPGRLGSGDGQLQPRDGIDRLRRIVAAVLRAARCRERAGGHPRRDALG